MKTLYFYVEIKKTQIFGIVKLTVKKTVLKFVPLHKEIVNFRRKKKEQKPKHFCAI